MRVDGFADVVDDRRGDGGGEEEGEESELWRKESQFWCLRDVGVGEGGGDVRWISWC